MIYPRGGQGELPPAASTYPRISAGNTLPSSARPKR